MRLTVMQPYFLPYAGYFRLMAASDLFVIYDCVQFPRRGWVHRNSFRRANGTSEWLTLPLVKAARDVRIDALELATDRQQEWEGTLAGFPCFSAHAVVDSGIAKDVASLKESAVEYIVRLLKRSCEALNLPFNVAYSSALALPAELRGQDRILAICRHFGAKTYINSPGGRALYDAEAFDKQDISLRFLSDYVGDMSSIAQRMADAGPGGLRGLAREVILQAEPCV